MADDKRARVVAKDSEDFDRSTVLRLGAWGICALLSVVLAVVAARTDLGTRRAAAAVAAITSPPRDPATTIAQVLARTAESDREARRITETVRSLSAERDRIAARIDGIEREMSDLTGSISKTLQSVKQGKLPMPEPAATAAAPVATLPAISLPVMAAVTAKPPTPAPVSTPSSPMMHIAPQSPLDPKAARSGWPTVSLPETIATTGLAAAPNSTPVAPPAAAEPAMVPTPPLITTENIPLPRPSPQAPLKSLATAPAEIPAAPENWALSETTASATAPKAADSRAEPQPRVEIGVDLGPALSMARLRLRWEAFRKAQGPASDGMRPLVTVREIAPNKPVEMRLVVGPVADVSAATQLCASLAGSQLPCQPAVFDGQRLALQ